MKRFSFLMLASATLLFVSCEKDSESIEPLVTSIQEADLVTNYFDEVDNEADEITNTQSFRRMAPQKLEATADSSRVVVTEINYTDSSRTKTITFTNWINPNCNQNIVKNGKIIIHVTGFIWKATFVRTITFEDFSINGTHIEGTKVITKTAANQFTSTCSNGKITFADGKTYTRNFTRTKTWVDGFATPYNVWDDVYTIEGSASGINRNGMNYTHTIVNPLHLERTCRFIVSGTISILENGKAITFDYGPGTCDNLATITYNEKTTEIKLRGGR